MLAQGGVLAQGGKGAPNAASNHGEAERSLAEHGAAGHGAANNSGQRNTQPRCVRDTTSREPAPTISSDGHFMLMAPSLFASHAALLITGPGNGQLVTGRGPACHGQGPG